MHQPDMIYKFNQLVLNKYHLYNGLFLKLPYEKIASTGMLLPILSQYCRQGLEAGRKPVDIVDGFFERFTDLSDESEKINFLFKVIQYVERQVVLFDSIEDASFEELNAASVQQSLKDMYIIAGASGKQPDWYDFLRQFSVRIVFTAHPTQFYPPAVQHIIHDLEDAIQVDDVNAIDELLQQLGQTPFVNREKPSPLDEAKSIIYYLRNVYYHAIGEMYAAIEAQYAADSQLANFDLFRLGFWPVTAQHLQQMRGVTTGHRAGISVSHDHLLRSYRTFHARPLRLQPGQLFRGIDVAKQPRPVGKFHPGWPMSSQPALHAALPRRQPGGQIIAQLNRQ